jgi:hypothetical protein
VCPVFPPCRARAPGEEALSRAVAPPGITSLPPTPPISLPVLVDPSRSVTSRHSQLSNGSIQHYHIRNHQMSMSSITSPRTRVQKRQPWPDDHSTNDPLSQQPRATHPTSGKKNGNVFGQNGNTACLLVLARPGTAATRSPEKISTRATYPTPATPPATIPAIRSATKSATQSAKTATSYRSPLASHESKTNFRRVIDEFSTRKKRKNTTKTKNSHLTPQ